MSGSSSCSSSSRASIPNNLKKTIQNLKEIAKNHSDDEIYAMLQECSMDPNETAQKLLFQEPFHEVRRKNKKKENNREPVDARWRQAPQGRVARGGRGNYPSRIISHDAGGEKNSGKENGTHQATDKGINSLSSPPSQDTESKPAIPASSSVAGMPNGPAKFETPVPVQVSTFKDSVSGTAPLKESSVPAVTNKTGKSSRGDAKSSVSAPHMSTSNSHLLTPKPASGSGLYASSSDPVLVPSLDARIPGGVGAIKREVGSQRTAGEATTKVVSRDVPASELSSSVGKGSEITHSQVHDKVQGKSQGFDGNQFSDPSQATNSLSRTSSAGSRPSSNYSNRSQQLNGPQKVGIAKEWKPKSTSVKPALVLGKLETTDVEPTPHEVSGNSVPPSSSLSLDEPSSNLRKKLEELQFSDTKHVIIPNHLQVPESERTGLSFGSFDANFGLATSFVNNDTESEKCSVEPSELSQENVENVDEPTSSVQIASESGQDAEVADRSQSPAKMPENLSSSSDRPQSPAEGTENPTPREPDISSNIPTAPEFDQSKIGTASVPDSSQYSVAQTAPTYSNFGLVPPMLGNQFATFEGAEPQARDATRIPSFLVQQPFDPATSYYTSMYRPTAADGDGRFSPLFAPAPAAKYSGNIAVLPAQTGQTPQESGNSLVLSSTGPAPLGTSSMMQTSVAVSQTPVPVFRQPPGVHISHYPHNYLPYSQYFPFYIPSPSMHPFLGNAAFPQQPPTGNMYQAPGAAGAAPLKYSMSQYKPTANSGNPSHMGIPTGYGTYNPVAVTSGSSTGSEDLASSQYKENNVYIAGQQSEGSGWIPTPGRDISAMQATSFYNLPTQGQHVTFPGIYHHPAQTVAAGTVHPMLQQSQAMAGAVEMVGPPAVYQQPQRSQMNWVNNY